MDPAPFFEPGSGRFASTAPLARRLEDAGAGKAPIVTYCNTGHFASLSWFVARELLGYPEVRLYDGSLVEWSADRTRPMVAGWSQAGLAPAAASPFTQ